MNDTFARLALTPRFQLLPERFFAKVAPTPLAEPVLAIWNAPLAAQLGLDPDTNAHVGLTDYLTGNLLIPGSEPLASVYCGHQFGVYVQQLGDGRAILIAEVKDRNGIVQEIQLKGAGPTPWSRRADGRAVLRSSIREYLCSEAMYGLGIPTTRALAMTASPEAIWRETRETAAVVARVAPTFVRFGHFEFYCHHGDHEGLRTLVDWTIEHFYPECADAASPALALLEVVIARTATLLAHWQAVGFCHGVMNTDNMSILGLTLDYGPFGFMDGFDAGHICNHSDESGRYAYNQQPQIALWNLQTLAQALLPLLDREAAIAALHTFQDLFETAFAAQFQSKLGLPDWRDEDWGLLTTLFNLLQAGRTDWTNFWRDLASLGLQDAHPCPALRDRFVDREAFDQWLTDYRERVAATGDAVAVIQERARAANPKYILRNHLAEIAIRKAQQGDFSEMQRLHDCLSQPFAEQPEYADYAAAPPDWAASLSVSCSS
ncbi:protein adenylyltransferase SelO [Silvimonas soli]|uniref:protein adenylyltransferase SelO n=1 Tax=Silvimonas soli TaxID=2980100 RepID=UPI0024B32A00|nr:YdiU family protein [Silvimonas soli]